MKDEVVMERVMLVRDNTPSFAKTQWPGTRNHSKIRVEKREHVLPRILARVRGSRRRSAEGQQATCQRMMRGVDLHRRRERPSDAVTRAVVREMFERMREVVVA